MKRRKYIVEVICPMIIKGSSTGCLPIQVSNINTVVSDQNSVWDAGRNVFAWFLEV